jgi:hypothetical protein
VGDSITPILPLCASLPVETGDGDVLLEEGSRTGRLVLVEGRVGVFKGNLHTTIAQPGAVFGEVSVLLNQPHSATVRCLAPSRFHVVHESLGFLQANPEILPHQPVLAQRLHAMTRYLMDRKPSSRITLTISGMVDEESSLLHHQQSLRRRDQAPRNQPLAESGFPRGLRAPPGRHRREIQRDEDRFRPTWRPALKSPVSSSWSTQQPGGRNGAWCTWPPNTMRGRNRQIAPPTQGRQSAFRSSSRASVGRRVINRPWLRTSPRLRAQ